MQLIGKMFFNRVMLGAVLLGSGLSASMAMADDDQVFGWVEKATLQPWDIEVKAKLDSGALTSSLDARDIEMFEQDDEEWVRFRLKLEDQGSGDVFSDQIERPLYREFAEQAAATSVPWCCWKYVWATPFTKSSLVYVTVKK